MLKLAELKTKVQTSFDQSLQNSLDPQAIETLNYDCDSSNERKSPARETNFLFNLYKRQESELIQITQRQSIQKSLDKGVGTDSRTSDYESPL